MGLPHYAVERGPFGAGHRGTDPSHCPVCAKHGGWSGDVFVPTVDKQLGYPTCYCRAIYLAGNGAYAFDPTTRTFLRRDAVRRGAGL